MFRIQAITLIASEARHACTIPMMADLHITTFLYHPMSQAIAVLAQDGIVQIYM